MQKNNTPKTAAKNKRETQKKRETKTTSAKNAKSKKQVQKASPKTSPKPGKTGKRKACSPRVQPENLRAKRAKEVLKELRQIKWGATKNFHAPDPGTFTKMTLVSNYSKF